VDTQFEPCVVNPATALPKTTAKNAIPSLVQCLPIFHHVSAIVAFIRHRYHDGVTAGRIDSFNYSATKAVWIFIADRTNGGVIGRDFLQDGPGPVGAAVVDDNNLTGDVVQLQL